MEAQWSLILFTVISGAGAWLFATSMAGAIAKRGALPTKMESIVAIVLLAVGGVASVTHLKHVDRIFEALNHPTSGIFVEAAMIGILIVLIAVYLIMLVRGSKEGGLKAVGAVAAVIAIVFTFACGSSYMMEARQAWMTVALPFSYAATAAAAGAGVNLLLKSLAAVDDKSLSFAGLLEVVLSAVAIVCCAAFFVYASGWFADAKSGAALWIAVTFVALASSLGCGVWAWKKPASAKTAGVAALAAGVIAAIAMRLAMWLVGTPVLDFFLMPLD